MFYNDHKVSYIGQKKNKFKKKDKNFVRFLSVSFLDEFFFFYLFFF